MKRSFGLLSSLLIITLISGCKKNDLITIGEGNKLIDSTRAYFENELLSKSPGFFNSKVAIIMNEDPGKWLPKYPVWEKANVISISTGPAVLVPVHFKEPYIVQNNFSGKIVYSSNDINQLLIYKDKKGGFHAEKLTFLPDSDYVNLKGHPFTGIISVETWSGEFLKRFKYSAGGKIEKYTDVVGASERISNLSAGASMIVTVCFNSFGYNYPASDPANGSYWSRPLGCQTYFIDDPNNTAFSPFGRDYGSAGNGGSAGAPPSASTVAVYNGNNPIVDVLQYTKCFTNAAGNGNTYSVTLCVEQPEAGSRQTWGFSGTGSSATNNPVNVGHAFLILNQTNATGSTVRNVGFFPTTGVTPMSPQSNGQLNNDANQDYNISLTITMDNSQFFQVVNYINTEGNLPYNLNRNNCTNFVLNALGAAGVNLPRTSGTWLGGGGVNPGDLGEDIREMDLPSNMTRTTITGTHPNIGFCY